MKPTTPELAFADYFGFNATHARMLAAFFRNPNSLFPISRLALLTGLSESSVEVYLCRIRQDMEAEAIDTIKGMYGLTDVGAAECRLAIREYRKARDAKRSAAA